MTTSSELPIGIFDSGIGGLTVVKEVRALLPHEDLVYLGDTARVPYGTKSPTTVVRFACEDTQFLVEQNVKAVVVACNTASAWALPTLERKFEMPIFGVIIPGAQAAVAATRNHRVGVIGTNATIRSQAYTKAILSRDDEIEVFARACPLLVPLVEEAWSRNDITAAILREYLEPMIAKKVDTLVLGCTHYPLLKTAIRKITGKQITLIDSAHTCARYLRDGLERLNLLSRRRERQGTLQPFVTDETERFQEIAHRFLGEPTEPPWRVQLPSLSI